MRGEPTGVGQAFQSAGSGDFPAARSRFLKFKNTALESAVNRPTGKSALQNERFPLAVLFLSLIVFISGCATTPRTTIPRATHFPAEALITQRGVLNTFFGKQFTLNGYLAQGAAGGKRLILTENFGGVLADLLIKPDGTVHVMRPSAVFKAEWIHYLAADVQCIFGNEPRENCPGKMIDPKHFVIKRRWYELDLKIVEIKPGPQSPEMFDETKAEKP